MCENIPQTRWIIVLKMEMFAFLWEMCLKIMLSLFAIIWREKLKNCNGIFSTLLNIH